MSISSFESESENRILHVSAAEQEKILILHETYAKILSEASGYIQFLR